MNGESIYINDSIRDSGVSGTDIRRLLWGNYVYAPVYTDRHRPMWLGRQLHYAILSYAHLYGVIPILDAEAIRSRITDLLERNRMPLTGNTVNVYLVPDTGDDGRPDIVIAHESSTIYNGYTVRSLRPQAVITNYEIPFAGHRTAVSLTAAGYMRSYAGKEGANTALRANRAGNIISSGDFPVLAVLNGKAVTPPAGSGAEGSAEREIMFRSCELAGVGITESDIKVADVPALEELMIFGTDGVSSVLSCSGVYFYNLVCGRIEETLPQLTEEGLGK